MNQYRIARIKDLFTPEQYHVFLDRSPVFVRSSVLTDNEMMALRDLHLVEQVTGKDRRLANDRVVVEYIVADAVIDANPFFKSMFNRDGKQ